MRSDQFTTFDKSFGRPQRATSNRRYGGVGGCPPNRHLLAARSLKPPVLLSIIWKQFLVGSVLLASQWSMCPAAAADDASADPVEQGRTSLRRLGSVPWYDASNDSLRPLQEPSSWWWWLDGWGSRGTSAGSFGLGSIMRFIAWSALAVVLVVLVIFVVRRLTHQEFPALTSINVHKRSTAAVASLVERLPVSLDAPVVDFLEHARQLYGQQRYNEAIVYFFCYQLVELDRKHFIRLARGKTNRQYLRELRAHRSLQPLVERTMVAFEDVFFGKHPLGREQFEACWHQLPEFNTMTQQSAASTV